MGWSAGVTIMGLAGLASASAGCGDRCDAVSHYYKSDELPMFTGVTAEAATKLTVGDRELDLVWLKVTGGASLSETIGMDHVTVQVSQTSEFSQRYQAEVQTDEGRHGCVPLGASAKAKVRIVSATRGYDVTLQGELEMFGTGPTAGPLSFSTQIEAERPLPAGVLPEFLAQLPAGATPTLNLVIVFSASPPSAAPTPLAGFELSVGRGIPNAFDPPYFEALTPEAAAETLAGDQMRQDLLRDAGLL